MKDSVHIFVTGVSRGIMWLVNRLSFKSHNAYEEYFITNEFTLIAATASGPLFTKKTPS